MKKAIFEVTPGYGPRMLEDFHYTQAVRIGNHVEISGQTGADDDHHFPDNVADEIRAAFANVERTLATVGAEWHHVVHIHSFHLVANEGHISQEHMDIMQEQFDERMRDHAPLWTALGVAGFGDSQMRFEIRVTAFLHDEPPGS